MASELNLGLDAFVFVDNNPAERERVRSALPEVTIADWPDDPAFLPQFAQDLGARYFNRLTLSVEDQTKTQQYRSQVERRRLSSSCTTLEDYLQALEMRAHLFLADPGDAPRLSQLTQKTNQFNATTRRYTVGEMESRISARDWIVLGASLSDRFGDSGIVGLAMATVHPENGVWLIDNFLLSCRVVGRTLEKSLLDSLSKRVRELGGTSMVAHYLPTQRNSLVEHLWRDLNFEWLAEKDHWHWDLDREALPSPYITTVLTSR